MSCDVKQDQNYAEHEPTLCRASKDSLPGLSTYGLFCVFDGHNGAAAAQHLEENLAIVRLLPSSPKSMHLGLYSTLLESSYLFLL